MDEKFRNRVTEVLTEELAEPEQWHYFSFADDAFNGVVIIKCHGITDGLLKINVLQQNPGGQVMAVPMPDEIIAQVPETHRNRRLTKEEVKSIWSDAKTIREHEAEDE